MATPAPITALRGQPAPSSDPITAVRSARAVLLACDDVAVLPVVRAFDTWLADGGDFAAALGMAPGWHSALRQKERDAALSGMAARYFACLCGIRLAREIAAAGLDYETRRYPRDRTTGRRPDGMDGYLFDIALNGGMPGIETLRKRIW
jgi:hypothetical protein